MISSEMLFKIAKSRFKESKILLENQEWDGAVYLCGYALELVLKCCIIKTLGWDGYPETQKEFGDYISFKIHKLDVLLHLSGFEKEIMDNDEMFAKWLVAKQWDTKIRYRKIGELQRVEAEGIVNSTRDILNCLSKNL